MLASPAGYVDSEFFRARLIEGPVRFNRIVNFRGVEAPEVYKNWLSVSFKKKQTIDPRNRGPTEQILLLAMMRFPRDCNIKPEKRPGTLAPRDVLTIRRFAYLGLLISP